MRIGYGFNRSSGDFVRARIDRLYIDTRDTERAERSDMLRVGIRSGDTLVLLAKGDLGRGAELPPIRRRLAERGVSIEVYKDDTERRAPGRPADFNPSPTQDKRIRSLWYDVGVYTLKHVIQRATEIYGSPVSRNQLDRRYGPRNGSMPDGRPERRGKAQDKETPS